ncbi:TetR/AcrR family transcriptional regulator [Oerskovia sp. Sa1BUA8]|uniref:TetR/AcrR family transcriptional regulator n=1 Tax=Oerskovia douganii TaxID=2762210 RepID=A0A9D5UBB8_9CELL|nr:TetR/AcrR family transcriptional regulator [Oerskovia douganii]MBE7701745.1 TetR/AcrR family transcriptional regulator [Oerskovia douganii]
MQNVVEPSAAPTGLRERKKRERREALIDAAQTLVLERGLDRVTVEDICTSVGVSTRTFFNYFASKDDAVLGVEEFSPSPEAVRTFVAGGPTGDLLADVQALVADLLSHQAMSLDRVHRALALVEREHRLLARHMWWVENLRTGLLDVFGRRRADHPFVPEPELLVMVVMSLLRTTTLEWERLGRAGEPVDHLGSVVDQLRALAGPDPSPH